MSDKGSGTSFSALKATPVTFSSESNDITVDGRLFTYPSQALNCRSPLFLPLAHPEIHQHSPAGLQRKQEVSWLDITMDDTYSIRTHLPECLPMRPLMGPVP